MILGINEVSGTGKPILPKIGRDYTLEEIERFALGDGSVNDQWRLEFVNLVNDVTYDESQGNFQTMCDEHNISWIFSQLKIEVVDFKKAYTNSHLVGSNYDILDFYTETKLGKRTCAIFYWGKFKKVLFPMECANILKIPKTTVFEKTSSPKQKDPVFKEEPKKETSSSSEKPEPRVQINNYYVSSNSRNYDDGHYGYQSYGSYYGGYGGSLIRVNIGTGRSYYRGGFNGGNYYHRSYTPTRTYNSGGRYHRSSGVPGHSYGGGNPYGSGGHSSGGVPAGARGHR